MFTGGSGLLAVNWALAIANDYDVVLGLHKRKISLPGTEAIFIDMETSSAFVKILETVQPDIVIHCAGLANVEACEADPVNAYHSNVDLSVTVAQSCKELGITFVYICTDHLFSGEHPLVSEEEKTSPVNQYGKTKLEAEQRVLAISDRNLSIRTNFYGWGPSYRQSFSDFIIRNTSNGNPVFLFDDFYYTPILIEELAGTVMALIDKTAAGIFNVAGNERISKYEFGVRLARQFQLDSGLIKAAKFVERKDLVKRPVDLSLSVKKVTTFLNRSVGDIDKNTRNLYMQKQNGFYTIIENA